MQADQRKEDIRYMQKALELASKGLGFVNPNPLVGAVIVKNGELISEGYHELYGGPHAEVNAIRNTKEDLEGATIYLNLEPCSHHGNTPPCSLALIQNKFNRVVIAMTDPNPLVAGKGIEMLRKNGIEVVTGILEDKARLLNEVFIKYITSGEPFVAMKTAMSLDGKIATSNGDSKWISNEDSRKFVHQLRNNYAAIMVGVETVIKDDPSLTCRIPGRKTKNPCRIIVDTHLRIPSRAKVLNQDNTRTIIATGPDPDISKLKELKSNGTELISTGLKNNRVNLGELHKKLGESNIDSILIEGGGTLNFSALQEGIVDKTYSFIAPKFIGGKDAITSVEGNGIDKIAEAFEIRDLSLRQFGSDILISGYLKK